MFKPFLLLSVSVFFFTSSQAQFDTSFAKKNILKCADSLAYGFKHKDWELFSRYSYPALIGSLGGKNAFIQYVTEKFALIPETAIKKYKPGKILQIIQSGRDLQAVLEINSVIEWQGVKITTTSHLIGESWSNGLFWTFFDSQNDRNLAKTIHPGLSDQLIIPPKNEKMEPLDAKEKNSKKKEK